VKSQERLSKAAGECSLGLGDTVLGTSHLGSVTRDEVEHGLGAVKLGDWRKDTASIASEEDDVAGHAGRQARNLSVADVLDGVGTSCVLSEGGVIVVDLTSLGVEDNVLEDGTVADGAVNIGLLLGREANGLGVATTLEVEDTAVTPAVLIVTDESTLRVGREGGLASSRQTEEKGYIAVLALVGGGVKGEDIVLDGHLVEEDGEDTAKRLELNMRQRLG
jgi:hypothetical protein